MGVVAGLASVHACRSVLEYERATLFRVTFEARFLVSYRLIHHARTRCHSPGGREGAVRIMAIGAGHKPLIHAMFEWHRELGAHAGVASVAQLRLIASQQKLRDGRLVNGMAIGTHHVIHCVRGAPNVSS